MTASEQPFQQSVLILPRDSSIFDPSLQKYDENPSH